MKKVIFDLETTGADKSKDRIVQMGIHMFEEKGNVSRVILSKTKLYNPEMPISEAAFNAHGITDKMVKNAELFRNDAKKLKKIFEDSELIGYNIIQFDIPVLMAEFERAGVELNLSGKVVDVMKLETLLHPRTLGAVYKRYTGQDMKNAHDAMGDIKATEVILQHQMLKIKNEGFNRDELMEGAGIPPNAADFFGKFKFDDQGYLVYNFGKHLNKRVLLNEETRTYATWILGESFPSQVKKFLQDELKKDVAAQFKKPEPKKESFHPVIKPKLKQQEFTFGEPEDDLPF